MKKHAFLACALLACAVSAIYGDSIDDAEAKRRGIPVSQVQAENALAKEKQKAAMLEKQIADLQKQIADLGAAPTPASAGATSPSPASVGTPITSAATAELPRESSPLYDDFVNRYLAGEWTTLGPDLAAKQKEIAALPAGNRDDLAYIRQAVAEGRPEWWDQTKKGKPLQFTQTVWKQLIHISFAPGDALGYKDAQQVNGILVSKVTWSPEDMDAKTPLTMNYIGFVLNGPTDLTCGDGVDWGIWSLCGLTQFMQHNAASFPIPPADKTQFSRAQMFWESLTAGYYGTPPVRRLTLLEATAGLDPNNFAQDYWASQRPIAAGFLSELKTHWGQYKTISTKYASLDAKNYARWPEFYAAYNYILETARATRFTLAEDRRLRDFFKQMAEANAQWKNSTILLPNKQAIDLDPAKDAENAARRLEFLQSESDKRTTQP